MTETEEKIALKEKEWGIKDSIKYLAIAVISTILLYVLLDNYLLLWIAANGSKWFLDIINIPTTVEWVYVAFYSPYNHVFIKDTTTLGSLFSFEIIKACAAIEGIALISALILATPTSWKSKGAALGFFVPSIIFANFFRIALTVIMILNGFSLYIAHEVIAAALTIIFIFIFVIVINSYIIPSFIDSMIGMCRGFYNSIAKRGRKIEEASQPINN